MKISPRILVVEDDSILRQYVMQALAAGGCDAAGAESAEEALLACQREGFDLVVSDVAMAGLSGPELAYQLWERRPDLPFLFMTGQDPEVLETCGLSGYDLIEKPFDIHHFLARVRQALTEVRP